MPLAQVRSGTRGRPPPKRWVFTCWGINAPAPPRARRRSGTRRWWDWSWWLGQHASDVAAWRLSLWSLPQSRRNPRFPSRNAPAIFNQLDRLLVGVLSRGTPTAGGLRRGLEFADAVEGCAWHKCAGPPQPLVSAASCLVSPRLGSGPSLAVSRLRPVFWRHVGHGLGRFAGGVTSWVFVEVDVDGVFWRGVAGRRSVRRKRLGGWRASGGLVSSWHKCADPIRA